MRVTDLKQRLKELNIATGDVFEKGELVQRLVQAQNKSPTASQTTTTPSEPGGGLETPLYLTSLEHRRIAAVNVDGGLTIQPTSDSYATIGVQLDSGETLSLLLDTACSGIVLRPLVVRRYNLPE